MLLCGWGCGQARPGEAAAVRFYRLSPSKQRAPVLGWWENVPFSPQVFSWLLGPCLTSSWNFHYCLCFAEERYCFQRYFCT